MTNEPTWIHLPSSQAPSMTDEVAICAVCHAQWQVRSENRDDARGCPFCGAPERAISIHSEAPTYGGARVYD